MITNLKERLQKSIREHQNHYIFGVFGFICIGMLLFLFLTGNDIDVPEIKAQEPELDVPVQGESQETEIEENPYLHIVDGVVTNPDSLLVVVNDNRRLPDGFVPAQLVVPNIRFSFDGVLERSYMRADAAAALEKLFALAEEEGIYLYAVSGFRSFERQYEIFNNNVATRGFEEASHFSAQAGHSEHQTGLAMDVSSRSVGLTLTQNFGNTVEGQWLAENAHRAGFIIRYLEGKEHITGFAFEPWHIRYVGDIATNIHEQGITLEEYLSILD